MERYTLSVDSIAYGNELDHSVVYEPDDEGAWVKYTDHQAALDAERGKVLTWQGRYEMVSGELDAERTRREAEEKWLERAVTEINDLKQQLATSQAEVEMLRAEAGYYTSKDVMANLTQQLEASQEALRVVREATLTEAARATCMYCNDPVWRDRDAAGHHYASHTRSMYPCQADNIWQLATLDAAPGEKEG